MKLEELKFQRAGTQFGGYYICLDLIEKKSNVISAGVGSDTSFDEFLCRNKDCGIIAIDPTECAAKAIRKNSLNIIEFINKPLTKLNREIIKMYKRKPEKQGVSESKFYDPLFLQEDYYEIESVSLDFLLKKYRNISVLKMDIEGAEYEVIESLNELDIPQVCIEFHQENSMRTRSQFGDTDNANNHAQEKLYDMGYVFGYAKSDFEITFVHKKYLT